jgi:DNA processing protein
VVIVSGLARGIDGEAHQAALDGGGGTIGVLGCGIDVLYPREHERLSEQMAAVGLLLSEFAPGEPPLQYHFPRRNRLIAALALGVLVVEASRGSGSLITVEHATALGREVLAVPGPIGRETSAGTNELIRDGAAVVLEVGDVLAALGVSVPAREVSDGGTELGLSGRGSADGLSSLVSLTGLDLPPPLGLEGEVLGLWRALDREPRHAEALAAACDLDPATTLVHLLDLELGGHARQLAGLRFVRVESTWR